MVVLVKGLNKSSFLDGSTPSSFSTRATISRRSSTTASSSVHDLATGMIQDHKDVQDLKANGRNREEVHGPGHFEVISQEGQPGLGFIRSSLMLDHILPDGVWAGWIETE